MTALETSSKFKVKGTGIINTRNFITHHLGEKSFELFAKKSGFLDKSIVLASSWYSIDRYRDLLLLASNAMNLDLRTFVLKLASQNLEHDLNGIYRFFMRASGPRAVLAKIPKIMTTYSNYAYGEIVQNERGLCRILYKVPTKHYDWSVWSIEGACAGILNVCKSPMTSFKIINTKEDIIDDEVYTINIVEIEYQIK